MTHRVRAFLRLRHAAAACAAIAIIATTSAAVAATAPASDTSIWYSASPQFTNPASLAGAKGISGIIYVTAPGVSRTAKSSLYIQGMGVPATLISSNAIGNGVGVDTRRATPGTWTLTASVATAAGTPHTYTSTFATGAATGTTGATGTGQPAPANPQAQTPATGATPAPPVPATGGDQPMQGVPEKAIFDKTKAATGRVVAGTPTTSAQAGDIVEIPAGNYNDFQPSSGKAGAYVTYRAAKGAKVVIDGGGKIDGSYVHVDGLTFTNSGGYGLEIDGASNIALTNVEIAGSGDGGMRIYGVDGLYVEGANVHGTNAKGTGAASEALSLEKVSNFELLNNRVHDNGEEGIDVKYGSTKGTVHHNAVWSNRGPNIYVDGASDIDVHHNWAWGATSGDKPGIMLAAETEWSDGNISNIKIRNNTVWDNGSDGISLWQGNFSGITVSDNIIGDGDDIPSGGEATYTNNVKGPVPDVSAIVGSAGGKASTTPSAGSDSDDEDTDSRA